MKKFILGFICGLLLMGTTFAATELNVVPNPFTVFIDGVQAAVEGYNINGFTYLKLADFKQAGLTVKFNETDRQIEITKANSSTEISENIQTLETTVPVFTPPDEKPQLQTITVDDMITATYEKNDLRMFNHNEEVYIIFSDLLKYNISWSPYSIENNCVAIWANSDVNTIKNYPIEEGVFIIIEDLTIYKRKTPFISEKVLSAYLKEFNIDISQIPQ